MGKFSKKLADTFLPLTLAVFRINVFSSSWRPWKYSHLGDSGYRLKKTTTLEEEEEEEEEEERGRRRRMITVMITLMISNGFQVL